MGLPFSYVRSSAKGHGLQNLIEGVVESGQTVVVVEDLISTGMSSLNAVKALEEAEVNVKGMVAIFSYGFDVARENFENAGVALKTLTDYDTMVKQALNSGFISEKQVDLLRNWRENPSEWGK